MTPSGPPNLEALLNPCGAAVRAAESALIEARRAFDAQTAASEPLLRAAQVLGEAGWLQAKRFADTLVLASPFAEGQFGARFGVALGDFYVALTRRNLRELACSPTLFAQYRDLNVHIASHVGAFSVAYEDFALAGRPVAPAMICPLPGSQLMRLRARYERALLVVLRGDEATGTALDDVQGCLAELVGPEPYDVWRLASGCARALRASGRAQSGQDDVKRFYARCNLLLADQTHGLTLAPRSFVRAALAQLWRDYALYGAAAADIEQVTLLNDYGLTVDWRVAGAQSSEAIGALSAPKAERTAVHGATAVREWGVLSINAQAYEDFLQTADASMVKLANQALSGRDVSPRTASEAMQSAEAAYALGSAACALGLGHIAALSDALGLAWRMTAHMCEAGEGRARLPEPAAIDAAARMLRAMLLRVAAGVAPLQSSSAPLEALTQAIERATPKLAGRAA